ncbi:MAG: acyl-CoA thioesterase [Pseudarcicella sp.]|nr:acyl-CoA thioesterase [Pseudarcicella sp.]
MFLKKIKPPFKISFNKFTLQKKHSSAMFILDPNKAYPQKIVSPATVRFQDCDPLNHLNNIKYFDYFFNAREDALEREYGFDFLTYFQKYQCTWVAYNHQIAYLSAALIKEKILVVSGIIHHTDDTVITEYVMTDLSGKHLKSVFWSTAKYFNLQTGKKTIHQPELDLLLKKIKITDINFESTSFESRIKTIKTQLSAGTYF